MQNKKPKMFSAKDPVKNLVEQINTINSKIKVFDDRVKKEQRCAMTKKNAGDRDGAMAALKRKNMYEKQLRSYESMINILEQQYMAIESTHMQKDGIMAIRKGNSALKSQISAEDVEDIMDDAEELFETSKRVSEILGRGLDSDDFDLEKEFAEIDISSENPHPGTGISKRDTVVYTEPIDRGDVTPSTIFPSIPATPLKKKERTGRKKEIEFF